MQKYTLSPHCIVLFLIGDRDKIIPDNTSSSCNIVHLIQLDWIYLVCNNFLDNHDTYLFLESYKMAYSSYDLQWRQMICKKYLVTANNPNLSFFGRLLNNHISFHSKNIVKLQLLVCFCRSPGIDDNNFEHDLIDSFIIKVDTI